MRQRVAGRRWKDEEVVEGLVLALLSQQIAWRRIEEAMPRFPARSRTTSLTLSRVRVATRSTQDFAPSGSEASPCPESRALYQERSEPLRATTDRWGTLEDWLRDYSRSPVEFIKSIASRSSGSNKLGMVGIAIACEFLKNVGFEEFMPDVHLRRLFSSARRGLSPRCGIPINRRTPIPSPFGRRDWSGRG